MHLLGSVAIRPSQLACGYARDGISVPTLVKTLRGQLPENARSYLHWGATSQDIEDTALVLRLKEVTEIMQSRLEALVDLLKTLCRSHRHTLMLARTRYQSAAPTVFGLKVANWLAPLQRQQQRLHELLPRLLVIQFGGAVGTLAALGKRGFEVSLKLAQALSLGPSTVPWHTQRDNIVEFANWMAMTAGIIGKLGQDLLLMAQSEIAEISFANSGKSSTMPQKSNPVTAETLVSLARYCSTQANSLQQAMVLSHERDGISMHLERLTLPNLICATASSLRLAGQSIETLQVNEDAMLANLESDNGMVLAEAASFELCKFISRQDAAELVIEACKNSTGSGVHMIDELSKLSDLKIDWQQLKNPENYLGMAEEIIDEILEP